MVKNTDYDNLNFNEMLNRLDNDSDYLDKDCLYLIRTCFKSTKDLFKISSDSPFRKLDELENLKIVTDNCSNTLFVMGWFYEMIADATHKKIENNEDYEKNKDIFLKSCRRALAKYELSSPERKNSLMKTYSEYINEIQALNKKKFDFKMKTRSFRMDDLA